MATLTERESSVVRGCRHGRGYGRVQVRDLKVSQEYVGINVRSAKRGDWKGECPKDNEENDREYKTGKLQAKGYRVPRESDTNLTRLARTGEYED